MFTTMFRSVNFKTKSILLTRHELRYFSNNCANIDTNELITEKDKNLFGSAFQMVKTCVTSHSDIRLKPVMDHYKQCLDYNIMSTGMKHRIVLTMGAYKCLTKKQNDDQLLKVSILGWCVELIHTLVNVSDDMADNATTRRGALCWHKKDNVGISLAVNDLMMFQTAIYKVLNTYFSNETYYLPILNLFITTIGDTFQGQTLDVLASMRYSNGYLFEHNYREAIWNHKGSYYSLYLPFALAMCMNGITDEKLHEQMKLKLVNICQCFFVQNDYNECFSDPNKIGSTANDIEEGKCTWLIVDALQQSNDEDRQKLLFWYGKKDPEMVKSVVEKYKQLGLDKQFLKYSEDFPKAILETIKTFPLQLTVSPETLFNLIMHLFNQKKT